MILSPKNQPNNGRFLWDSSSFFDIVKRQSFWCSFWRLERSVNSDILMERKKPTERVFHFFCNVSSNGWLAVNVGGWSKAMWVGRFPVGSFRIGYATILNRQTQQLIIKSLSELRWLIRIDFQWVLSNNILTLICPSYKNNPSPGRICWSQRLLKGFSKAFVGRQGGHLASLTHTCQLRSPYQFLGVDFLGGGSGAFPYAPNVWNIYLYMKTIKLGEM